MLTNMDIFLSLNGHTNNSSLPLRFGIKISQTHQQFSVLEGAVLDEVSTKMQRQYEIEDGRRHYIGTIYIPNEDKQNDGMRFPCRVVLSEPRTERELPRVITILSKDSNAGDLTVTKHLEEMQKRGKISTNDLITVFHPAYTRGELKSSNDCEDVYSKYVKGKTKIDTFNDAAASSMLNNPEPIIYAMNSSKIEDTALHAPLQFTKLPISNVRYEYVMADAYIDKVQIENDMIKLECINSKGTAQELHSFKLSPRPHLRKLHEYAFNYLKEREGQRAIFAICTSKPCEDFIAESVTAISLQIMRSGIGKQED